MGQIQAYWQQLPPLTLLSPTPLILHRLSQMTPLILIPPSSILPHHLILPAIINSFQPSFLC